MIRFTLVTALTVALLPFVFGNLQVVELRTLVSEPVRASLAFLLLGAFAGGFVTASFMNMHQALRERQKERRLARASQEEDSRRPVLPEPPQLPTRNEAREWKTGLKAGGDPWAI